MTRALSLIGWLLGFACIAITASCNDDERPRLNWVDPKPARTIPHRQGVLDDCNCDRLPRSVEVVIELRPSRLDAGRSILTRPQPTLAPEPLPAIDPRDLDPVPQPSLER